jgi:cell division protein FtsI (penicillin-binding protein 3)
MVVFGAAVIGKAYKIQTERNGYWSALADSLSTDLVSIPAERGNIYSADDRLLATSLPSFEIRMDLASEAMTDEIFNENVDGLARKMAEHFGAKSYNEYKRDLISARRRGNRYYLVQRKVDYSQLHEIRQWPLFELGKYKGGLIIITKQKRMLPYGQPASRTIGYVRDNAQSIGLEAQYDEYLSGKEGRRLMQRIAGGTWIPLTDENAVDPQNGKDVYVTIDVNLQDVAQSALRRSMAAHDADHGCVVVMEVETGAIRAIANLGRRSDGSYGEIYNYAIGKRTQPGSTFKVASMLALLEDGHVKPEDTVDVNNGRAVFYGHEMLDAGGWNKYKYIPAWKAFSISSNVGIAKFANEAYRHDQAGFYKRLRQYHLTDKTGIGIKGEPSPFIKDPGVDEWSRLSVPWMSTGYEVQLTPLQVLTFYNAIANGGKMVRPRLVEKIMDHGQVIEKFEAEVIDRQISTPQALADITDMMVSVVEEGTARRIRSEHYKIAGKTGTARLHDPELGWIDKYQASFAGFYPADDPKYSCIVVVLGPSRGMTHGGSVAAPVFKEIADKVMSTDMDLQEPYNLAWQPAEDSTQQIADGKLLAVGGFTASVSDYRSLSREFGLEKGDFTEAEYIRFRRSEEGHVELTPIVQEDHLVPDVRGMGLDDALYQLENIGLAVNITGTGKVVYQSLRAGQELATHSSISIRLQ